VGAVEESKEIENHEGDCAQRVPHDTAGAEGSVERRGPPGLALPLRRHGRTRVGVDGNHHADEAREDGRQASHNKADCCESACVKVPAASADVGVRDEGKDDDGEASDEDETDLVLGPEESAGAGTDSLVDRLEL
jgi:hypothetical protein